MIQTLFNILVFTEYLNTRGETFKSMKCPHCSLDGCSGHRGTCLSSSACADVTWMVRRKRKRAEELGCFDLRELKWTLHWMAPKMLL